MEVSEDASMGPLWKIRSGRFAGWKDGDLLYDSDGENVGFFDGEIAFSIRGDYIGELYNDQTIGKRQNINRGGRGSRVRHVRIARARMVNRVGVRLLNGSIQIFDRDFTQPSTSQYSSSDAQLSDECK